MARRHHEQRPVPRAGPARLERAALHLAEKRPRRLVHDHVVAIEADHHHVAGSAAAHGPGDDQRAPLAHEVAELGVIALVRDRGEAARLGCPASRDPATPRSSRAEPGQFRRARPASPKRRTIASAAGRTYPCPGGRSGTRGRSPGAPVTRTGMHRAGIAKAGRLARLDRDDRRVACGVRPGRVRSPAGSPPKVPPPLLETGCFSASERARGGRDLRGPARYPACGNAPACEEARRHRAGVLA